MSNQVLLGQALRSIVLKGSKETEERYERELAAAEADRKRPKPNSGPPAPSASRR